ncbi:flagellar filament capping protein FliD [Alteromonas halophila]|uniref:Flagellar hook-associated protein 2 n=1 Tax=Alteromonas halophila TaxID=516698 RepID=A0A918JD96_9ALTE|nr:flagellar filament capping protein FliD [Alteromonas halophila]GGW73463.1 flagellar hook-associated protein 2 [Alteromonas halophila]
MSISSLGVGSGLALTDLVNQLLQAERRPKEMRLDAREEKVDAEISGLGQIKSKLSEFKTLVDGLRSDSDINGREPKITNPSEDDDVLSASASSSALKGKYEISVSELATGSRAITDEGSFTSTSDSVLSTGTGSLTFSVPDGDSFTVDVAAGMTLTELREAINDNADNFGVGANIIDTGTAAGPRLVFTSSVTGEGNNLTITNDGGNAELDKFSTAGISAANITDATNAKAQIDGIDVESSTNKFENTIANVSFEVNEVSPLASDGLTRETTRLEIGFDKEGLEEKIRGFVEGYNALIQEIDKLGRYGETPEDEDGALAGDSLLRGIKSGLSSILSSSVSTSELGGLFQLGIEFNKDGELEIGSSDFGLGSGNTRLQEALSDNFDDIATLFTDENEGIAVRLHEFANQYTNSSGLLTTRERAAQDERNEISDDREQLERRMSSYEDLLRQKYTSLDQTVARLNQTGSALFAALG